MAVFAKFNAFTEALAEGKHNLAANALKVLLTNTAPNPIANAVKADVVEIAPGNGYVAGGKPLVVTSSAQTAGVYKLAASDITFTAAGGSLGPFQFAVLYNDTAAADDLIGFWDYGSALTLADTEVLTVDFAAGTVLQLT